MKFNRNNNNEYNIPKMNNQQERIAVSEYSKTGNYCYISNIERSRVFSIALDLRLYNVLNTFKYKEMKDELQSTITFLFKQKLIEDDFVSFDYLFKNFGYFIDWTDYFPNKLYDGIFEDLTEVQKRYLISIGFNY